MNSQVVNIWKPPYMVPTPSAYGLLWSPPTNLCVSQLLVEAGASLSKAQHNKEQNISKASANSMCSHNLMDLVSPSGCPGEGSWERRNSRTSVSINLPNFPTQERPSAFKITGAKLKANLYTLPLKHPKVFLLHTVLFQV